MSRKSIYVVCIILVLGVVGNVLAEELQWDNSSGDSLWRTPENWSPDKLPGADDALYIDWLKDPTEVIIDEQTEASCNAVVVSNDDVYRQDFVV